VVGGSSWPSSAPAASADASAGAPRSRRPHRGTRSISQARRLRLATGCGAIEIRPCTVSTPPDAQPGQVGILIRLPAGAVVADATTPPAVLPEPGRATPPNWPVIVQRSRATNAASRPRSCPIPTGRRCRLRRCSARFRSPRCTAGRCRSTSSSSMAELITQRIQRNAAELRLHAIAENPDELIERAEAAQLGYREFLDLLLESEVGVLEGRRWPPTRWRPALAPTRRAAARAEPAHDAPRNLRRTRLDGTVHPPPSTNRPPAVHAPPAWQRFPKAAAGSAAAPSHQGNGSSDGSRDKSAPNRRTE